MRAPAAVIANESTMSAEMITDMAATQKILWDMSIGKEEANEAVSAFNARWLAAGGIAASTLVGRKL